MAPNMVNARNKSKLTLVIAATDCATDLRTSIMPAYDMILLCAAVAWHETISSVALRFAIATGVRQGNLDFS